MFIIVIYSEYLLAYDQIVCNCRHFSCQTSRNETVPNSDNI